MEATENAELSNGGLCHPPFHTPRFRLNREIGSNVKFSHMTKSSASTDCHHGFDKIVPKSIMVSFEIVIRCDGSH
jgi:hypothetical protein